MVDGFRGNVWEFYGLKPIFRIRFVEDPSWLHNRSLLKRYRIPGVLFALFSECARQREDFIIYSRTLKSSKLIHYLMRFLAPRHYRGFFCELHDLPDHLDYLKHVRGALTNSETLRQDVLKNTTAIHSDRIRTARNGVALNGVNGHEDGVTLRKRLGLPLECKLIVYTGRLRTAKGVDVLIDAFTRLGNRTDVRLLLLGKLYDDLRKRLPEPQHLSGVEFMDFVPPAEVHQYQRCADVLVLPSTRDLAYDRYTMPLKMFEYMAAGRPVVASRLEGISEVIQHRRNGLLVEPSNPEQLAEALRELLDNPELRRSLATKAKEDVLQYTWEARAQRVVTFIQEALA
jgi:glycosyltransferase involved in cell wall biosynthesis